MHKFFLTECKRRCVIWEQNSQADIGATSDPHRKESGGHSILMDREKMRQMATGMVNICKIGSSQTICFCAKPLSRGELITRSGKRSIHLHATYLNKRLLINATVPYNLLCICSEMCLWIVQRNTAKSFQIRLQSSCRISHNTVPRALGNRRRIF